MTNLESLRSLQTRIREATGPDRFLDADIWRKLIGDVLPPKNYPKLTADPDGLGPCVALQRAVLPGWSLFLTVGVSGDYAVIHEFAPPCRRLPSEPFSFRSYNICLTALDAILSALIAQEEAKEKADA